MLHGYSICSWPASSTNTHCDSSSVKQFSLSHVLQKYMAEKYGKITTVNKYQK